MSGLPEGRSRPAAADDEAVPESVGDLPRPVDGLLDAERAVVGETPSERERPSVGVVARRFAIVGALVALDLWSKAAAFRWLTGDAPLELDACDFAHRRVPLIGEWFAFMRSQNKGAAFGKLDSVPYLLVGGRVLAVLFLTYLIVRASARKRVLTTALVLILAGALGNLYDNLVLDPPTYDSGHPFGYVRDFIDVYFTGWKWHFPTFNVADSCITVGAVLLLLTGFQGDSEKGAAKASARASE